MNWATVEEFTAWAWKHHPCVRELEEGYSTTVQIREFGNVWFGPEDGFTVWSSRTFVQWVTYRKFEGWPASFDFNGWHFVKYREIGSDPHRCVYRRDLKVELARSWGV